MASYSFYPELIRMVTPQRVAREQAATVERCSTTELHAKHAGMAGLEPATFGLTGDEPAAFTTGLRYGRFRNLSCSGTGGKRQHSVSATRGLVLQGNALVPQASTLLGSGPGRISGRCISSLSPRRLRTNTGSRSRTGCAASGKVRPGLPGFEPEPLQDCQKEP